MTIPLIILIGLGIFLVLAVVVTLFTSGANGDDWKEAVVICAVVALIAYSVFELGRWHATAPKLTFTQEPRP